MTKYMNSMTQGNQPFTSTNHLNQSFSCLRSTFIEEVKRRHDLLPKINGKDK